MNIKPVAGIAAALAFGPLNTADAQVIYDGSLGTEPSAQGWFYLTNPIFSAVATHSAGGGGTTLDTTSRTSDSAGYFKFYSGSPGLPTLDRQIGFKLDFSLKILAENHSGAGDLNGDGVKDRGGFSVLVVTSDKKALELAFWTDQVWAYADKSGGGTAFTHAESAFLSTGELRNYSLAIRGDTYALSVANLDILTGPIRDFGFFGAPYTTANLMFMGDDTGSASSKSFLTAVSIQPMPAILPPVHVPAPPTWTLVVAGLGLAFRRRRLPS